MDHVARSSCELDALGRALLAHSPGVELAEIVGQRLAFDLDVPPLVPRSGSGFWPA
jgi:hypothetical protein